ncbi:uncharacterized protein BDV17DRAFT_300385 [Aspergillus undulatus]|uniref:uncharacterized protein n=1 Tax=Aspergillus undulatus TaxID=1810928 RepID=UPI003CCE451A
MSLDHSILESHMTSDTQNEIASRFWGSGSCQSCHLRSYFQYYTEQYMIIYQSYKAQLPLKTHQDILEIATDILDNLPRSEVKEKFMRRCTSRDSAVDDALDSSIDLAVRLVFMLDVGVFRHVFSAPLSHDSLKLGRDFNVSSMVRIAGFKVELTSNLTDHLRLRDAKRTVTVFHHASFLKSQQQSMFFPTGFIDKTLATLALLFPKGDRSCEKWYKKQGASDELDDHVLKCGPAQRRIDEYNYWHDRLVILKEEFDESRPSTLSQWWNDRREGTQWYTLWVAISLTLVFGLFQSITGAMQAYKSYHP